MSLDVFTLQIDKHNDLIVCPGKSPRKGYQVVFTGTHSQCMHEKYEPHWQRIIGANAIQRIA